MRFPLTHPPIGLARIADRSIVAGLWRLADPKLAIASIVPFGVGAALAWRDTHQIDAGLAVAAFIAIFFVEVGKNAVNELFDFRSGADPGVLPNERTPYSGGRRVLVDRLLTERDLVVIAWLAFSFAAVIGAALTIAREPLLLLLGAAAALVSVLYSMPPVKLSYRGFGELAVFAVYGPGIVLGSVLLFGGTIGGETVDVAIVLGVLVTAVLLTNELPDERADRAAGKRTIVVRIGRDLATSLIGFLFGVAFAVPITIVAYGGSPNLLGALLGVPTSYVAWLLLRREYGRAPIGAQTATLITYVLAGVGLAIGALVV